MGPFQEFSLISPKQDNCTLQTVHRCNRRLHCFVLFPQQLKMDTEMAETYQNNSSCGSDEGIQEPALQRQPTAAGEGEEERKKKGIDNSHPGINFQVNGTHQLTTVFPTIVRGEVPYAVTPLPMFCGIIKCRADFKQCFLCSQSSRDTTHMKLASCCVFPEYDWVRGTLFYSTALFFKLLQRHLNHCN